jgi:hypothetical protein
VGVNETLTTDFELERERKKALDDLKEDLIQRAANFLTEDRRKPDDIGYSQIRNLVVMAQMAATSSEIKAFIEYQMGRDANKPNGWFGELAGEPFGQALLKEIGEIEELARNKRPDDKQFTLRCLAQFFGYLAWRTKYLDECTGEKNKRRKGGGERRGGRR